LSQKKFEETITSETPIIITEKTFALANEQRVKTLQRKGQLNRTTRFYLLRDFMICESCGTPMGARMKEQGRKPFYYCPLAERKFNKAEADDRTCLMKRSLNIPTADSEIWNVIKSTIANTAKIKNKFNSAHLLGSGLADNEIIQHKIEITKKLDVCDIQKSKLEKAIVKIESDNLLGAYDSIEIYKGVKRDLTNKYKSIKTSIETLKAELTQLGNHKLWLDWIDQFGEEFNATDNLSETKKKRLINGVVKDILVNYDSVHKLHRVRANFRLPALKSMGEIIQAKDVVLKRVGITPNTAETIEKTWAPETENLRHYSTVVKFVPMFFNSNWENELSSKLDSIDNRLKSMVESNNRISQQIRTLTYVTQSSFENLGNNISRELKSIDSSIKFNNLLTTVQTYQLYKVNKNTKGLKG